VTTEMTVPTLRPPTRAEVLALEDAGCRLGEPLEPFPRDPGGRLVAGSASYVVYLATDTRSRAEIDCESRLLRWAAGQGIAVPDVVESREAMLVVRRAPDHPQVGARFGEAAVETALRVAGAEPPAVLPRSHDAVNESGVGRLTQLLKRVRDMRRASVDVRRFTRLRSEISALPRDTLCHGDFHVRNLLYDSERGAVAVVDWEHLRWGPRGTDLARLWPTVSDPAARAMVRDALEAQTGDRGLTAVLLEWWSTYHTICTWADGSQRGPKLDEALARLDEAVGAARRSPLGAVHRSGSLESTHRASPEQATYRAVVDPRGRWLRGAVPQWRDLVSRAAEQNVFYEPEVLLPALDVLDLHARVDVVAVLARHGEGPERVVGMFPTAWVHDLNRLPARVAAVWCHQQNPCTVPFVDPECADAVVAAYLDWFDSSPLHPELLRFERLVAAGPLWDAVQRVVASRRGVWYFDRYDRALFEQRASAEAYLGAAYSSKHRNEFRRKHRRLTELGDLRTVVLASDGPVTEWIETFLLLEHSQWKGAFGTSFLSSDEATFFRRAVTDLHERGRLRFVKMSLDSHPVAMYLCFTDGDRGWAFKTAFDESFSHFSPGALLFFEESAHLHETDLIQVDSCARKDHPLMDRIWVDRLPIADLVIARNDPVGRSQSALIRSGYPVLQQAWHRLKYRGHSPNTPPGA